MFICMPEVKLIIHFFLKILILKNLATLLAGSIWAHNWNLKFCQIWGWCWNINKNISFHFRLLPRKINDKIFQKIQKKLFWGHVAILAFFAQIWVKMNSPRKKALSVFKYSNYLPLCNKSEKTIMPFLRKMLNWWMDGKTL